MIFSYLTFVKCRMVFCCFFWSEDLLFSSRVQIPSMYMGTVSPREVHQLTNPWWSSWQTWDQDKVSWLFDTCSFVPWFQLTWIRKSIDRKLSAENRQKKYVKLRWFGKFSWSFLLVIYSECEEVSHLPIFCHLSYILLGSLSPLRC